MMDAIKKREGKTGDSYLLRTVRWMETVIFGLNWAFDICAAILLMGCISTFLYHTAHRQEWRAFMVLLSRGIVAYLLLIVIAGVLIAHVKTGDKLAIMSYEKADRIKRMLIKEEGVFICAWFVATIVGRIMLNGGVQVFTGDPWWAALYSTSFRTLLFFVLCKSLHGQFICEPLLKAMAHGNS